MWNTNHFHTNHWHDDHWGVFTESDIPHGGVVLYDMKTLEIGDGMRNCRHFTYKPSYTELLDHEMCLVTVSGTNRIVIRHGTNLYAGVLT